VSITAVSTPTDQLQAGKSCNLWRVVGAAVQGTSHTRSDKPCQDWQGYRCLPDGGLVVAVADGAGSARRAERGSRRAVEAALESAERAVEALLETQPDLTEADWQDLMRTIFGDARRAVAARARSERHRLREYATTLTVVIAADGWVAVGQIGDGAVVILDMRGEMYAATRLQKGEYANETHFLTLRDAVKRVMVVAEERPIKALAAMSDGLIRLALRLPSGDPHQPFFQPLFKFIARVDDEARAQDQLAAFLSSERVCARTDDDKSLVLALSLEFPDLPEVERQDHGPGEM
jgi:hypothetical protein